MSQHCLVVQFRFIADRLIGPGQGTTLGIILGVIGILPLVMGLWGRCMLQFLPGGSKASEAPALKKGRVSEDWTFSFGSRCRRTGSLGLRRARWGEGFL